MNTDDKKEQDAQIYSQLQIQQKLVEPDTKVLGLLDRNLQLGFIDDREFRFYGGMLNRAIIIGQNPSPLYKNEFMTTLHFLESNLVLSGSKHGHVRDSLNTHTQIQKQDYREQKNGFFSGVFKKQA